MPSRVAILSLPQVARHAHEGASIGADLGDGRESLLQSRKQAVGGQSEEAELRNQGAAAIAASAEISLTAPNPSLTTRFRFS